MSSLRRLGRDVRLDVGADRLGPTFVYRENRRH